MIHERILKEYQRLEAEIQTIQQKLDELPEGKLICARNGTQVKWYQSDNHQKIYIPKQQRPLAEQLALKKYYSIKHNELLREAESLKSYLDLPHSPLGEAEQFLLDHPAYGDLTDSLYTPLSEHLRQWKEAPYEACPYSPEKLIHKTNSGHIVRSKSEVLIDTFLSIHQIPFRYECLLKLGESIIYPDFTIRHPKTGQFFYWEHFGQMDKPSYRNQTFSKLQLYSSFHIIPSIHLITTFETLENPLTSDLIETIIEYYFL